MTTSFQLTIDGGAPQLLRSFELHERAHVGSSACVVLQYALGDEAAVDPNELLGKPAMLELAAAGALRDPARRFHGIVDAVEIGPGELRVTIVPRAIPLRDTCDHRVFLEKDSVAIAEELLEEAGLAIETRVDTPPPVRAQCVQAFESTLSFLLRILAEDGVSLWIEHREEEDVVVLGDSAASCQDLPGGKSLRFEHGGDLAGGESITHAHLEHAFTHDGAAVADYDPEKPALDQNASVGGTGYSLFRYPGRHQSPDEGRTRARLLLEAARSERIRLRARTQCRHVAVGYVIEITDAPRDDLNGSFRILEVRHRGSELSTKGSTETRYEAEIFAVPVDQPTRPEPARRRSLGGLQTMTVTGSGDEIHTDDRAQIKAKFRWDRRSPEDDTASAWIRPLQPALSGGFFLPRVGWEVLVGFRSEPAAFGDTPIELGRMIHGQAPPAESLPGQRVRSNWGTLSTPGGGKQNRLRFDDAAGNECMQLDAGTDYNERTENDKDTTVTSDETNTVGGNHTFTVAIQQKDAVTGSQTYTVGGNREMTTVGTFGISAASEVVVVGGMRKFDVGGDFETKTSTLARIVGAAENVSAIQETNRHVSGASTIGIGGTWLEIGGITASTGVLGASTLTVAGPMSVRASTISINATTLTEQYAGAYKGEAGGKLAIEAPNVKLAAGAGLEIKGADVSFKATSKIIVKAGGVTITLTPGSIKVKGKLEGDKTSVVTNKEEVG